MIFRTSVLTIFYLSAISFISAQDQTLVPWKNEGKWGFCDTSGRVVVPAVYDNVNYGDTTFGRWHATVYLNGFTNWVDSRGRMLIPVDSITDIGVQQLSQSRWVLHLSRLCGDKSMVVDSKFNLAFPVLDGDLLDNSGVWETTVLPENEDTDFYKLYLHPCKQNGRYAIVNGKGQIVGGNYFHEVSAVFGGRFVGKREGDTKFRIYNKKGKPVGEFPYQPLTSGSGGMFVVNINDKYACVDFDGNLITPAIYKIFRAPNHLYVLMLREDNTLDVINLKGGVVANISDVYDTGCWPSHFFVKKAGEKWVGYDKSMHQFSSTLYDSAPYLLKEEGQFVYRFKQGNDSVYTDMSGRELRRSLAFDRQIPARKDQYNIYSNLLVTQRDKLYGLIRLDPDGRQTELVTPRFEYFSGFDEGYAHVKLNGKYGIIDTAGNLVFPFDYERIVINRSRAYPEKVYFDLYKKIERGRVDQTGRVIIPFIFSEKVFQDYYRWETSPGPVRIWDKKVFVETAPGQFTLKDTSWSVQYSINLENKEELHLVRKGNESGVMSNFEHWLIPFTRNQISITPDGLLALVKGNRHTAVVDLQTRDTLAVVGDSILPHISGRYITGWYNDFREDMVFTYWDPKLNAFVPCKMDFNKFKLSRSQYCLGCVPDDFVVVRDDTLQKSGIRRHDGTWLLPCEYDYIGKISDYYFEVKKDSTPAKTVSEEDIDSYMSLDYYAMKPPLECDDWPRPGPPYDLIDTAGRIIVKNYEALYALGDRIGSLSEGYFNFLPNEKPFDWKSDQYKLHTMELNDSLLIAGMVTGFSCWFEYEITGIFKRDGTVVFPLSTFDKGMVRGMNYLFLKGKNGYAIYDLNGRRLTGDVFPSAPRPDLRVPGVFRVYTGVDQEVYMNWSGKILGPVR